ncbi:unnamed protein product [Kuraishia capsulata CBS 1993]|uniref:Importin-95 n=1 Tax=Kuraishia capsulata CBS 1993 TaxID=1382522 RepID=W6MQX3_9ASCO|nr:uncharacterized protein KUCA_T00005068001 [Kuraishia capsulata CBS 1993]CDK29081.1 unnamed protein product [Kuraishia capsulata CBS 1993]
MDIGQVLENAILSPDPAIRSEAERQLENAATHNFVGYLGLLTQALADANQKTEVRMLAGIALKNQLAAKDSTKKLEQAQRWISLDSQAKAQIKETALQSLLSQDDRVANSAAQLVAAIADIELPRSEWSELMHIIVENTKAGQPVNVKRASLLTIGYICETADPNNAGVAAQANGILIAIVQGAQSSEPSTVVRLTAIKALVDSLEFIGNNFQREGERNYIMQVVCEATQAEDTELQASAFGALAKIMSLYYQYMSVYMEKALYGLTVSGMQSQDEKVACMAVEFWSTVCEEELEIAAQKEYDPASADELSSYNFALVAIQDVLPTLLTLLTRQNEDPEDDDWSVAMAAGACLQLFAQNTENYVVQPTLQFVEQNLSESDWRKREAAVMAFGSILDGPDRTQLKGLIAQALAPILNLMKDPTLQVKETVAWCLGRIADLVIDAIDINAALPQVIEAILQGLQDHPKVSTNCCWTLINLVEQLCGQQPAPETTPMSQYYHLLVPALVTVSGRSDNEYSAKTSAYEALSAMVLLAPNDVMQFVNEVASIVMERLGTTIGLQPQATTNEEKATLQEEQANILSLLTNIIRRVRGDVLGASDDLMDKLLRLAASQEPNSVIEEDIFITISAIASQIDQHFDKYMPSFLPFLTKALENTDSPVCDAAIGLIVDVSHSLGEDINKYCQGLMSILGNIFSKTNIRRELRPLVLSAIGDIASSVGSNFIQYLEAVMAICSQAQSIQPDDGSIETEDYVLQVKESVLDTYVGIISGLGEYPQAILPFISQIFTFLMTVYSDPQMSSSDGVCKSAVGLIGDLAAMYPNGEIKEVYAQEWVSDFIKKTKNHPMFSQATKDTARWAKEQQRKQLSL